MSDTFVGDTPTTTFGPPRTVLRSIYEISPTALEELVQWIEQRGLRTTVSQVTGLTGYNQVGYQEQATDVVVGSGATGTVLTLTVVFNGQNSALITVVMPSLEFTSVSGGDAVVTLAIGGTSYDLGRVRADRALAWPVLLIRQAPVTVPASVVFTLAVQSVTGAVTVHAGAGYGVISMRVTAKYP